MVMFYVSLPSPLRHGHGSMLFSSGATYDGEWQYDKMSGSGVMRSQDGATVQGSWNEGYVDGCALFTWPHGVSEYRQYKGGSGMWQAFLNAFNASTFVYDPLSTDRL